MERGARGGTNGVRLRRLRKKNPAMITNRQTATLTNTSALVSHADCLMPVTATTVSTATMAIAPTFTTEDSPKIDVGRSNRLCR